MMATNDFVKISLLPSGVTPLSGPEEIPVVQAGTTYKFTSRAFMLPTVDPVITPMDFTSNLPMSRYLEAGLNVTITDNGPGNSVVIAATGGSGSPGGATTEVQFNEAGAFGGSPAFVFLDDVDPLATRVQVRHLSGFVTEGLVISAVGYDDTANMDIHGGAASDPGRNGGYIHIRGGYVDGVGSDGGPIVITGGDGEATSGLVNISGGSTNGANGNGGSVLINGGLGAGTGIHGDVQISVGGVLRLQILPEGDWELAGDPGAAGEIITSAGPGAAPVWAAAPSSPPGGANTQIQYNDGGVFGGDADFTFDETTGTVTISSASGGVPLFLSDGTVAVNLSFDSVSGRWGTTSNHPLYFKTNNTVRGGITEGGFFQVAAPPSNAAAALTVSGNATAATITVASGAGTNAVVDVQVFRNNSTLNTVLAGSNLQLWNTAGSAVGRTTLQQSGGQTEIWQADSGLTERQVLRVGVTDRSTYTRVNDQATLLEVGQRGLNLRASTNGGLFVLTASDNGQLVEYFGAGGGTVQGYAAADGVGITLSNRSAGDWTVEPGSGTLTWFDGGGLTVGNHVIPTGTVAYLNRQGSNWFGWTVSASAGGSGSPGGANTQIQFNDSGAFGGEAGFTYDPTTATVVISDSALTPRFVLIEGAAAADNRRWEIVAESEAFKMRLVDDADTTSRQFMVVERTADSIGNIEFYTGAAADIRMTIGGGTVGGVTIHEPGAAVIALIVNGISEDTAVYVNDGVLAFTIGFTATEARIGSAAGGDLSIMADSNVCMTLSAADQSVSINFSGTMTEAGSRDLLQRSFSASDNTVAADRGKMLRYTGTGGHTLTLDTDLVAGALFTVANYGTGALSIAESLTGALNWMNGSGTIGTGTRVLAVGGVATVYYTAASDAMIWGVGLT